MHLIISEFSMISHHLHQYCHDGSSSEILNFWSTFLLKVNSSRYMDLEIGNLHERRTNGLQTSLFNPKDKTIHTPMVLRPKCDIIAWPCESILARCDCIPMAIRQRWQWSRNTRHVPVWRTSSRIREITQPKFKSTEIGIYQKKVTSNTKWEDEWHNATNDILIISKLYILSGGH